MASKFEQWRAENALEVVRQPDQLALSAMKFVAGDHWQNQKGWLGPLNIASAKRGVTPTGALNEIKRGFISQNASKEVLVRHLSAVLGREPRWTVAPRKKPKQGQQIPAQQQEAIEEADDAFVEWWDARDAREVFAQAAAHMLQTDEGYLRLFLPPGLLKVDPDTGEVTPPEASSLAEAMSYLYLHAPEPGTAGVGCDRSTMDEVCVYVRTERVNDRDVRRIEVAFVDRANGGQTVFRILRERGEGPVRERVKAVLADAKAAAGNAVRAVVGGQPGEPPPRTDIEDEAVVPLGGRLPVIRMRRDRLITEQVQQLQRYLNLGHSTSARNTTTAGFRERIITNAQQPKEVVKDEETGKEKLVPMDLPTGGASVAYLTGLSWMDREKQLRQVLTPGVHFKDPVDAATFRSNKQLAYEAILQECMQMHALISGDATASGESRLQARADFATSLRPTKAQLDKAGRKLFEMLLAWAAWLCGQEDRFAGLRVTFDCRIDTGPLTSSEQEQIRSNAEKGFITYSTARTMLGVEDPDAEEAAIEREEIARAERQARVRAAGGGQTGGQGGGSGDKPPIQPTNDSGGAGGGQTGGVPAPQPGAGTGVGAAA